MLTILLAMMMQVRHSCCPDCVEIGQYYDGSVIVRSESDHQLMWLLSRADAERDTWAWCMAGPGVFAGDECMAFDVDDDGDCDLRDFAEGQR